MPKTYAQMTAMIADFLPRVDLTSQIPDFLNAGVHQLERKYNFRFMRVKKQAAIVSGDYLVTNPMPRYKSFIDTRIIDSSGIYWPITHVSVSQALDDYDDLVNYTGRPFEFSETSVNETLALSIGTTADTKVASSAFSYLSFAGTSVLTKVAAETSLAAATVPSGKWGVWRFTINDAGTITCTGAAANGTTGYDTEALAQAALPSVPAYSTDMGYVTVLTKVGSAFVAGTDSLFGGAAGNVASVTNYYVSDMPEISQLLLRPTADASYTLDLYGYQYSPDLDGVQYTSNWWLANAWEVALYGALLEATPYMQNLKMAQAWKVKYDDALRFVVRAEKDEQYGQGPLNIRGKTLYSGPRWRSGDIENPDGRT